MSTDGERLIETVTLSQAREMIKCLAHRQSILLLSAPGMGKSDIVAQAAVDANLPCRSLLGTQIAPEDVSGIPRIIGERSVFCPPRVLLPESNEPFCLFLDELPACTPDVQKAFYSLLLERRIGEHALPPGTWVVAAGNRTEDRALVRTISSALVNRVIILHVRIDVAEWLMWAFMAGVRADVRSFIEEHPEALLRPVPKGPVPFSTPRAWASLSRALDLTEKSGILTHELTTALALGRVSDEDAYPFAHWVARQRENDIGTRPALDASNVLNTAICDMNFSVRTTNICESEGIHTLGDLVKYSAEQLLELRNFGERCLTEVREALANLGLSLANEVKV
jgi:hypothetical protein